MPRHDLGAERGLCGRQRPGFHSEADQAEVIASSLCRRQRGNSPPAAGPRVPINSYDFGPGDAQRTYNFDNVTGDVELRHFDDAVTHGVKSGMIPMT